MVPYVTAALNYLLPQQQAVHTYAFDPPDGGPRFNGKLAAYPMRIHDARQLPEPPSLAREGFMRCDHVSSLSNFWDEAALAKQHFPEVESLIAQQTGAREVIVFDHTLRRRQDSRPPLDGMGGSFAAVREPVGRVHADYTPLSGPQRMRMALGPEREVPSWAKRYIIYGLWRPLNASALRDAPLAIMDARSLALADLVPNDLIYRERRGQTYTVTHNDKHRWYYVPELRRDEVLVFTHFDGQAAAAQRVPGTPHTAFEDPTTPSHADPRQSLELRALALFDH